MSVQPMRPPAAPIPVRSLSRDDLRDIANGVVFFGLFGLGLLIPVVLPLYAYLTR